MCIHGAPAQQSLYIVVFHHGQYCRTDRRAGPIGGNVAHRRHGVITEIRFHHSVVFGRGGNAFFNPGVDDVLLHQHVHIAGERQAAFGARKRQSGYHVRVVAAGPGIEIAARVQLAI